MMIHFGLANVYSTGYSK